MFRQTDEAWNKVLMTSPEDLPKLSKKEKDIRWDKHSGNTKQGDTIGRFGCLLTALTNAYNYYFQDVVTPEYFNAKMRENNGYFALYYDYDCEVGQESFLVWDIAKKVFKFKTYKEVDKKEIDIDHRTKYFIARVPFRPPVIMSGHYNLIVGCDPHIKHFDSDTGAIRTDWGKYPDYRVIQIEF